MDLSFLPILAIDSILENFNLSELMAITFLATMNNDWLESYFRRIRKFLHFFAVCLSTDIKYSIVYSIVSKSQYLDELQLDGQHRILSTVGREIPGNLNNLLNVSSVTIQNIAEVIDVRMRGNKLKNVALIDFMGINELKIIAPALDSLIVKIRKYSNLKFMVPNLNQYDALRRVYFDNTTICGDMLTSLNEIPLRNIRLNECLLIVSDEHWDIFYEHRRELIELEIIWNKIESVNYRSCAKLYTAVTAGLMPRLQRLCCHFTLYQYVSDDVATRWPFLEFSVHGLTDLQELTLHIDNRNGFLMGAFLLEMFLLAANVEINIVGRQRLQWILLDNDRWFNLFRLLTSLNIPCIINMFTRSE